MAHKTRKNVGTPSLARKRPVTDTVPRRNAVQPDAPSLVSGGFTALMEKATQEILSATYWFDPAPHSEPYAVTVRFSGHRVDVKGRLSAGDRFVQDETIEAVVPGSGPISLTTRVHGIRPGSWVVTAHQLQSAHPARGPRERGNTTLAPRSLSPVARLWRRWAPSVESTEAVSTCLTPFAHVPGILPGIWGAMAALGIVVALTIQWLVISSEHLAVGPVWTVSLLSIAVGIIGAKAWYLLLYRALEGWCIQGFVVASTLTATILLIVLGVPVGVFLDETTPGLLLGMTVGRIGCFFAGCCGGPPTASRFGVWSSDQRVGAYRVPTQLMESGLAGILGLAVLVAILHRGPVGGAFFVVGLSAYTLVRQGILHLRAEPRKTKLWSVITLALMALALIVAVILLVR
jgi:phosphatidylglycerol---prolipoprotein diacylglyceryl transferase